MRWICSSSSVLGLLLSLLILKSHDNMQIEAILIPYSDGDIEYYDHLRTLENLEYLEDEFGNSNIIQVDVPVDGSNTLKEYRLAELKSFLPLSNENKMFPKSHLQAAAALLAVYHFNNINDFKEQNDAMMVISDQEYNDIKDCNVKLTMDIVDSQFDPIESTKEFTNILQEQHTLKNPLPSGVIGAFRSATTSPLAVLTGVNDIPQISYASTSTDFDVKEQFPLFGRTVTSAAGEAEIALSFFKKINADYVGVLYMTDAFGSSLQKAFQDAANDEGIETDSVAFSYDAQADSEEINNAMKHMMNTQYRLFYAICFEQQFATVINAAYKYGIIGPDYLWTFPGLEVDSSFFNLLETIPSPALPGIGMFSIQGGVSYDEVLPIEEGDEGTKELPALEANPTSGYEKFRVAWREAVENDIDENNKFTNYVRAKLPVSLYNVTDFTSDYAASLSFMEEPSSWMPLIYDAVISMGLSMCRASINETFFTGHHVFEQFSVLDFEGASGRVLIERDTGTRDNQTLTFQMYNLQKYKVDDNDRQLFKLVPTGVFGPSGWEDLKDRQFIYSDGTTVAPESLPEVKMNFNYIDRTGRAAGYFFMGIVMVLCVLSILWIIVFRNEHVIVSSQPLFLVMVSLGAFIMASTIIPISMEELVVENCNAEDLVNSHCEILDSACMAAPWLYLMGAMTTLSALFAKTRGIHKAYTNPELDFIHVTSFDIFSTYFFVVAVNAIVMSIWTVKEPLEYVRTYKDATDEFNRKVESFGRCENGDSVPFVVVVLVINILFLIVGNWWAYQSRNIETEYFESRYIGISMAAVLQAWCMGIPILIVVWDTPAAKFFVQTGIIFVTALAFLALIYVPKIIAVFRERKKIREEEKKRTFSKYTKNRQNPPEFDDDFKNPVEEDDDEDDEGDEFANDTGAAYDSPSKLEKLRSIGEESSGDIDPATGHGETKNSNTTTTTHVETSSEEFVGKRAPGVGSGKKDDEQPSQDTTMKKQSSLFRFSGAMKSSEASQSSARGIKVVHNPRSEMNLNITQGHELSREQLVQFKANSLRRPGGMDVPDNDDKASSSEVKESAINSPEDKEEKR